MKVIFLDFDGVLNNDSTAYIFGYNFPTLSHYNQACPDATCVRLMDILLQKSGAKIVVSSSWRRGNDVDNLQDILGEQFGLKLWDRVIDKTDDLVNSFGGRGNQIDRWLKRHPEVTHHVIIDDSQDAFLPGKGHIFECVDAQFGFQVDNLLRCLEALDVERK